MRFIPWSTLLLGATHAFVATPQLSRSYQLQNNPLHDNFQYHHQQGRATAVLLRDINERMAEQMGVPEVHSDNEWHPRDPARTIPQLLVALWHQITQAGRMVKGVSNSCRKPL
jgi:hypothetical protein